MTMGITVRTLAGWATLFLAYAAAAFGQCSSAVARTADSSDGFGKLVHAR
jgi:hypothetical protein